jgi:hypothetical protein
MLILNHLIREDGCIKIVLVTTIDNDPDLLTENVNKETYERHVCSEALEKKMNG